MSILVNESYSNPNTPLWAQAGAGDPSTWSNYPATNDVNMDGYYITNCNDLTLATGSINGVSNIQYSTDVLNNPSFGGVGGGAEMQMTNLNINVADVCSGAPQMDFNTQQQGYIAGITGTLGVGGQAQLLGGTFSPTFYQSDLSQQQFRVSYTYNIIVASGTRGILGMWPQLVFGPTGYVAQGSIFNSGTPLYLNPASYYDDGESIYIQGTLTDVVDFQGNMYLDNGGEVPCGYDTLQDLNVDLQLTAVNDNITFNTTYATFTFEPLFVNPTQQ